MSEIKGKCFLLESDEKICSDIAYSLKLIKLEVLSASNLDQARTILSDSLPDLVIVRSGVDGEAAAGLRLVQAMKQHPRLQTVPTILLGTPEDIEELDDILPEFTGSLVLPVEFPTFTKDVQAILDSLADNPIESVDVGPFDEKAWNRGEWGAGALVGSRSESKRGDACDAPVSPCTHSSRRLVVAYSLQLEVLEALKKDSTFLNAELTEVPKIVSQLMERISSDFDVKKLLD